MKKICLNMIVKDEAHIIRRCLDSLKKLIQYWVIVDTGSSDHTKEIIQEHMKDIPGELHQCLWENWGKTRNKAFELAKNKGDYILFMDADDILEFDEKFVLSDLNKDLYNMWRGTKNFSYLKPQIVKGDMPWKWIGVTHEFLGCDQPYSEAILDGIRYVSIDDGATRQSSFEKFQKNIKLLEAGLVDEPYNARYMFYLAESYRDIGDNAKALECYQKRVNMGGWGEEVFYSKLQIGHCLKNLSLVNSLVIEAYKDAFAYRPHRLEPIYYITEIYNQEQNYEKAYDMLKFAQCVPVAEKKDVLFNEDWINNYGLQFQMTICGYYTGHYEEALLACNCLLGREDLPNEWRKQVEDNRRFSFEKLNAKKIFES